MNITLITMLLQAAAATIAPAPAPTTVPTPAATPAATPVAVGTPDAAKTDDAANAAWEPLPGTPDVLYDKASVTVESGKVTAWVRRKDQPGMIADDRVEATCPSAAMKVVRMRTSTKDGKYVWTREPEGNEATDAPASVASAICRIKT